MTAPVKPRHRRIPIGHADGRPVYLNPDRRAVHMHVIGASGQGKSKFLEHCIRQDIAADHGVCLIDPEGDLYDAIVAWCAANDIDKIKRVHLFDPSEGGWRFSFNPLFVHQDEKPRHRVDNVIEALAQVWGGEDSQSTPAIRTTLRAVLAALIAGGYTMAEAFYLTSTKDPDQIAGYLADQLDNPILQDIWRGYQMAPDREHMIEFGGTRRRLVELLEDNEIREILAGTNRPFDFREVMDKGDIVLVNLSPEAMGDDPARAFGALLVREMFYCASRRPPKTARDQPFYAYIDECAEFLTRDISRILARSRKRGLHVILAHQWLEQLRQQGDDIYQGVMGIQNKVVFGGLSDEDATILADQLFRSEYDLETPIDALTKPGVVGYRRTWLNNWSSSHTTGTVETESYAETEMESASAGTSLGQTVVQNYDADGWPTGTYTVAVAGGEMTVDAHGTAVTRGHSSSDIESFSETEGASEALEPILENLFGGVHSLDNIRHMAIARLRAIPPRHAVVKGFNTPTFDIATRAVDEPLVSPEWIARFKERVLQESPYTNPADEAREALSEREQALFAAAADHQPRQRRTPGLAPVVEDDEGLG